MIDPQCQRHIFRDKERLHKLNPKPELPIHCSPYPLPPTPRPAAPSLLLLHGFFPCSVLQQLSVHFVCRQLNVTDHRSTDEAVFHRQLQQMKTVSVKTDSRHSVLELLVSFKECTFKAFPNVRTVILCNF